MKKIRKITGVMYHDPGHAWLRVKRALVVHLNLENHISCYSYQRGGYVYLEEDSDLEKLLNVAKLAGIELGKIEHRSSNRYSRIRNYEFFKPCIIGGKMRQINFDGLVLEGSGRAYLDHDTARGSYYAEILWDREGSRYRAIWLVDDWKVEHLDPEDCCDWDNPDQVEYLGD